MGSHEFARRSRIAKSGEPIRHNEKKAGQMLNGIVPAFFMCTLLRQLYHNLLDCARKLTVCGTSMLLAERIIPTGIIGRLPSNTPHCAPLERGDWTHHDSIDIALLWSENQTTKEYFFKTCHREGKLYHNLLDCARKLTVCGTSMLLAERIIPLGIMACSH